MADNSPIEWLRGADDRQGATWNIITGCSVVSAGCRNCYAMRLAGTRMRSHPSREGLTIQTSAGPVWNGNVRFNSEWLDQPLRWRRPRMIFVCAHGDLFHESVPDGWIDRVFAVMALAPWHTFLVLTKRALYMRNYITAPDTPNRIARTVEGMRKDQRRVGPLPHLNGGSPWWPLPNVWMGVSVENQGAAEERIPHLLSTPAALRWISAEPLLGPVELKAEWLSWPCRDFIEDHRWRSEGIDWVVAGGESGGPRTRPMHPDWPRSLRDMCAAAKVPFLLKQWGDWANRYAAGLDENLCYDESSIGGWVELDGRFSVGEHAAPVRPASAHVFRLGKKHTGRLLDGVLHDEYPVLS
jgi:protein gp37